MRAEPLSISSDEQELLKLAEESSSFTQHPMWRKIEIFLNANVQEALDDIRSNQSTDGLIVLHKNRVWAEREKLRDSLIAFVKGPIKDARDLLEQIEQAKKDGYISAT
jgi:hypothetical protein